LAFDLDGGSILLEDRRAGETEKLSIREEFTDRLVILPELRTVAFVEDEDDALVAQRL
jgi:hypothetical protein